jgi:hypothetical protein
MTDGERTSNVSKLPGWWGRQPTQLHVFLGALVFVGLGLLIIWFTKAVIGVSGDALFVAELFVAVLVFLILTGQISELTAGGVTAKFRELAKDRISPEPFPTITADGAYIVQKGPLEALERLREQGFEERKPVILSLTLGEANASAARQRSRYQPRAVRDYVRFLRRFERFYFVMFIRPDERLVGYLPSADVERALEAPGSGGALISAVNAGEEQRVRTFPGIITNRLTTGISNADALDRMAELNLDAMIAVDADDRPVGVVERERLTSQMLVAMTRA